MTARIVKFRGNPHPAIRHGEYPIVIVLPVIRVERYIDPSPKRRRRTAGSAYATTSGIADPASPGGRSS